MNANDRYPLPPFVVTRVATLCEIMRTWPLATIISGTAGSATITALPLIVRAQPDGAVQLLGHIDSNNVHASALSVGAPVSFHFLGPDVYASPDLYPDPQLPGWLYLSVQGDGHVDTVLDEPELRALLHESTVTFGAADQRFALDPADPRIDRFIGGIRGFSIAVTRISGIAKLAQDKGAHDARLAAAHLANRDHRHAQALFDRILREPRD